ncbi:hypothetical protein VPNG_08623 [Cytospora leucostoma]|uniref:Uncharacterized protein n=1 Tax=Cytospora leucostoma TaxID=1230097 RepID=A0A423W473_9PEZI|nr:hypothetical protein VPNG_08623 [Cytospora leucostoma]
MLQAHPGRSFGNKRSPQQAEDCSHCQPHARSQSPTSGSDIVEPIGVLDQLHISSPQETSQQRQEPERPRQQRRRLRQLRQQHQQKQQQQQQLPRCGGQQAPPSSSSSSTSALTAPRTVAEALESARDCRVDRVVSSTLEAALSKIWDRVVREPESYVMTDIEFGVFNLYQQRFSGDKRATEARRRFWDNSYGPGPDDSSDGRSRL